MKSYLNIWFHAILQGRKRIMYYNYGYESAEISPIVWIISLALSVLMIVAYWRIFEKAGEAGWKSLIPIYSQWIMFKIAFGSGLYMLLMFVPVVNFVISIMYIFKFASAYGKGIGFGLGLLFLSPIFILLLAFGDAEYVGPQ